MISQNHHLLSDMANDRGCVVSQLRSGDYRIVRKSDHTILLRGGSYDETYDKLESLPIVGGDYV